MGVGSRKENDRPGHLEPSLAGPDPAVNETRSRVACRPLTYGCKVDAWPLRMIALGRFGVEELLDVKDQGVNLSPVAGVRRH